MKHRGNNRQSVRSHQSVLSTSSLALVEVILALLLGFIVLLVKLPVAKLRKQSVGTFLSISSPIAPPPSRNSIGPRIARSASAVFCDSAVSTTNKSAQIQRQVPTRKRHPRRPTVAKRAPSKVVIDPANLTCSHCGKMYLTVQKLKRHLHTVVEKTLVCPYCNKSFGEWCNLDRHIRTHNGNRPFECPTCGKNFTCVWDLNQHFRIHAGVKPFQCEECGKRFTQYSTLTRHELIHSGDLPFPCRHCEMRFRQSTTRTNHERAIHQNPKAQLSCGSCHRVFRFRARLREHISEKHQPSICLFCDKGFKSRALASEHMQRHHASHLPFQCSVCHYRFKAASAMLRHERMMHRNATKRSCIFCDRTFTSTASLQSHLKTHTQEVPYECYLCKRRFNDVTNLKRHLRSQLHDNDKFPCISCRAQFEYFTEVESHMKEKHRGQLYVMYLSRAHSGVHGKLPAKNLSLLLSSSSSSSLKYI